MEERHKSRGRKSKKGTGKLRITGLIRSPKEDRQLQTAVSKEKCEWFEKCVAVIDEPGAKEELTTLWKGRSRLSDQIL